MMQKSNDLVDKINNYQRKKYGDNVMKLSNIRFECNKCRIHFTPSIYRAKALMKNKGVINECRECENNSESLS